MNATTPILELKEITKHFGAIKAVDGVSFSIMPGECVGLVGDNGAGKSTIVKVISGYHPQTSGRLLIRGKEATFASPSDSRKHKIETVYQNLALVEQLGVSANFFLGREIHTGWGRTIRYLDRKAMRQKAAEELQRIGISIQSADATVSDLSGGQRQSIAIARSIFWGSECLILDEPTAALGVNETNAVAELIQRVVKSGVSVLIVSHDIDLITKLCSRIVVLRQGKLWSKLKTSEVSAADIVHHITGTARAA
ncbi:MAG: ATP-binding cassette domain-containing protein [Albidovulum sp.]|nr:ATP-binding cassette domain-containing protein [Albidovulum sp.]MDE0303867.1 ATP-binding cassette domain-containing protein [Albidovulum sp.]MDE0532698.1 ATP-binding cassette domain-containing protein [Albidovulum sp.]